MEARRERPNLEPIWTDYQNLGGFPRTAFRAARSPSLSASPMRSTSLPGPVHPLTPAGDSVAGRHDRVMLQSLDPRSRWLEGGGGGGGEPLSPIAEQASLASPMAKMSVASSPPSRSSGGARVVSSQLPRRRSISAEARSMLLSGLPASEATHLGSSVPRRQSAPAQEVPRQQQRRNSLLLRQQLRAWGHVYYGSATTADVFVAAAALRRPSAASSSGEDEAKMAAAPGRLTVRARVRPRALERKPFVIQRSFDVDALRATLPEASPTSPGTERRHAAARAAAAVAVSPPRRDGGGGGGAGSRAGSAARTPPDISRSLMRGINAVPVHLDYARLYLPVLAALMLSGHIRGGDIIDLPLPHPEVWPVTVAHIYTGQGEVTEAMKQNILHLGGRA